MPRISIGHPFPHSPIHWLTNVIPRMSQILCKLLILSCISRRCTASKNERSSILTTLSRLFLEEWGKIPPCLDTKRPPPSAPSSPSFPPFSLKVGGREGWNSPQKYILLRRNVSLNEYNICQKMPFWDCRDECCAFLSSNEFTLIYLYFYYLVLWTIRYNQNSLQKKFESLVRMKMHTCFKCNDEIMNFSFQFINKCGKRETGYRKRWCEKNFKEERSLKQGLQGAIGRINIRT